MKDEEVDKAIIRAMPKLGGEPPPDWQGEVFRRIDMPVPWHVKIRLFFRRLFRR